MTVDAAPAGEPHGRARRSWLGSILVGVKNLALGTLLCLTPVTALIALGWMARYMRSTALAGLARAGAPTGAIEPTRWLLGTRGSGLAARCLGGLWLNIKAGLAALASLAMATLPFAGLWLFAWWAGWENSFNKGYEQSWVGPSLGLTGVALGLPVMAYLPMALAHQAFERRWQALFEFRRVRCLVAHAGWRYCFLAAATVVLAVPLSAARGLPVFIEQIVPGFADMSAEEVRRVAGTIAVTKAAYVFATLVVLRRWAARLHAHAAPRAVAADGNGTWSGSAMQALVGRPQGLKVGPGRFFRLVRLVLLLGIWFGLVVQLFVSQFLNHAWVYWLNHPYLVLPWMA